RRCGRRRGSGARRAAGESRDAFSGAGTYPTRPMPSVLSIAGSDPTGGAGIQADCQVAAAFGVHAAAVPTALTLQDGLRVRRVLPVFPTLVLDQCRLTLEALRP